MGKEEKGKKRLSRVVFIGFMVGFGISRKFSFENRKPEKPNTCLLFSFFRLSRGMGGD